jgi:hypothetical protein
MKNVILRFLYSKYRSHFYGYFVEEMIGDIPQKIQEPAMTFLAQGKDKIEKWCWYWITLIQSRIVTDKSDIETQQGMILLLKIFMNTVKAQHPPRVEEKGEPEPPKVDHAANLEETIRAFKESRKK